MTLGGPVNTPPANNAPPTVIVSYRIWQDVFGGDPAVVGKAIRFAEITTTVAGVAPRGFDTPPGASFWFQIPLDPRGVNHSVEGFMRVKPGTTIERARSEMAGVMAGVARDFPLLARGAARGREMAVRVALGAGRGRIVRQLLTESILLATVGAVVGVFGAYAFVRLLLTLGASQLRRLDAVSFDGRVLLFALIALVVSGVFVGFAPALRLAATDVNTLMNEGGRSGTGGRGTARWLGALTIAEVALAVTLVAGAGWLVRRSAIVDEARKLDPQMAIDIERASDIVDRTLSRQRLGMTLMLGFGIAAVALAAVGIYGVIAYGAAQRRSEVAIRLALGATPSNVFWLTLKQGRTLAVVGATIGLVVAYFAGRIVSSWLYEVQGSDPMILGAATTLVVGIALVATMIPAVRAARLDRARVLRP